MNEQAPRLPAKTWTSSPSTYEEPSPGPCPRGVCTGSDTLRPSCQARAGAHTPHAGPSGAAAALAPGLPAPSRGPACSVCRVRRGVGGSLRPSAAAKEKLHLGGGGGVSLPWGPAPTRPRCCRPGSLNPQSLSSQIRSLTVQGQGVGRAGSSVAAKVKLSRASLPGWLVAVFLLGTSISVCKRPLFIRAHASDPVSI